MNYQTASPNVDKFLEPDGSQTTRSGTVVAPPSAAGALHYLRADPIPDKWLRPDGSIGPLSPAPSPTSSPAPQSSPETAELEGLRTRVRALEKLVAALQEQKATKPKRRKLDLGEGLRRCLLVWFRNPENGQSLERPSPVLMHD